MKRIKISFIILIFYTFILNINAEENRKNSLSGKIKKHIIEAVKVEENGIEYFRFLENSQKPKIVLTTKDTVIIHLKNNINKSFSLYLQGQPSSSVIVKKGRFPLQPFQTIELQIVPTQVGISWFHPEYENDISLDKGLYFPIIVDDKNRKITFNQHEIIFLDDLFLDKSNKIISEINTHRDSLNRAKNIYQINFKQGINIESKKNSILRLSLINSSRSRVFVFAIEDHNLMVIGYGMGYLSKPFEQDKVLISPAGGIDILVKLDGEKEDYKIINYHFAQEDIIGVLSYKGVSDNKTFNYEKIKETQLNQRFKNLKGKKPSKIFELAIDIKKYDKKLLWSYKGKDKNQKNFQVKKGELYHLRIRNKSPVIFPIYLRDKTFSIVFRSEFPKYKNVGNRESFLLMPWEIALLAFYAKSDGDWMSKTSTTQYYNISFADIIEIK